MSSAPEDNAGSTAKTAPDGLLGSKTHASPFEMTIIGRAVGPGWAKWLTAVGDDAAPRVAKRVEQALLDDRGDVVRADIDWTTIPANTDPFVLRPLLPLFDTHLPPGWHAEPAPVAGRSLTALTPTPGRVLAGVLAILVVLVFLTMLTLSLNVEPGVEPLGGFSGGSSSF